MWKYYVFYLTRQLTRPHDLAVIINLWISTYSSMVKFSDHLFCESEDFMFSIFHVTSRDRMLRLMCFYGCKHLTLSHHLSMFLGNWSSGSGDIMYLILFYVWILFTLLTWPYKTSHLKNHATLWVNPLIVCAHTAMFGWCRYCDRPVTVSHHPPSLVAIGIVLC